MNAGRNSRRSMGQTATVTVQNVIPSAKRSSVGNVEAFLQDIPGNQEESYNGSARITVRMEKLHAPMPM